MPFEVNEKMCDTCIFGANSPVSRARFEDLKHTWETEGIVQQCHHATIKGHDTGCRGHYEAARRNAVQNYPVLGIVEDCFGLVGMDNRGAFDLSENLGLIIFVDVELLPDVSDSDEQ